MLIDCIGFLMFICFATYVIPSLIQVWRSKASSQHSIYTPILGLLACSLGLFYGSATGAGMFILIDYSLGVCIHLLYIYLIIRYKSLTN